MKTQIIKFVFAGFLLFSNTFYSQTNSWQCGVQDPPGSSPNIPYIGTQNVNLVVVYLDFPDGRIGGNDSSDN